MSDYDNNPNRTEEFKVSGKALVEKVKALAQQGNIRRIVVKTEAGKTLVEIPLIAGVVGGVFGVTLFPMMAILAALGTLIAKLTIVVEKSAV